MESLAKLQEMILSSDNRNCFIEREMILRRLEPEYANDTATDKYPRIFAKLLEEVSVPIDENDIFVGRVVEALPPDDFSGCSRLLWTIGHCSPDYGRVLRLGLSGIVADIASRAKQHTDTEAQIFAANASQVADAVRMYCLRYAEAAERSGKTEAAKALRVVPFEPAYDLYSALQGIWILHMILSCYIGARDYAFGNFDQYMLPYYQQARNEGMTDDDIASLVSGFFIKTNEICGTTAHDYRQKPVLCHSSKQYVNLGGTAPNAFSVVCMEAASRYSLTQPQVIIRLKPDADPVFTDAVFQYQEKLLDRMHLYNYDIIVRGLKDRGIADPIAEDFSYSACSTFDLHYHNPRGEYYIPSVQIFERVLHARTYDSIGEILDAFRSALTENMLNRHYIGDNESMRCTTLLDSLLMTDTAKECRYAYDPDRAYCLNNLFFSGIATIGDSLMVLDTMVFREKRYTYQKFMEILDANFKDYEVLLKEIQNIPHFGNDTENDRYAVMVGDTFIRAVDNIPKRENEYNIPGFYSLNYDNMWKDQIGATPDGRLAGAPYSENQSPTYGADQSGITALLKSVARLPFVHAPGGCLNLTFSKRMTADVLRALVLSYFQMEGLHIGITVLDRNVLCDAMEHPEKHKSLTVRLYGFSEYFTSLSLWQQLAVLERTEY